MDERGRILVPAKEREKLGLKAGTKFELIEEKGTLLLKPTIPSPLKVKNRSNQNQINTA